MDWKHCILCCKFDDMVMIKKLLVLYSYLSSEIFLFLNHELNNVTLMIFQKRLHEIFYPGFRLLKFFPDLVACYINWVKRILKEIQVR
jgi:hypothetical protein